MFRGHILLCFLVLRSAAAIKVRTSVRPCTGVYEEFSCLAISDSIIADMSSGKPDKTDFEEQALHAEFVAHGKTKGLHPKGYGDLSWNKNRKVESPTLIMHAALLTKLMNLCPDCQAMKYLTVTFFSTLLSNNPALDPWLSETGTNQTQSAERLQLGWKNMMRHLRRHSAGKDAQRKRKQCLTILQGQDHQIIFDLFQKALFTFSTTKVGEESQMDEDGFAIPVVFKEEMLNEKNSSKGSKGADSSDNEVTVCTRELAKQDSLITISSKDSVQEALRVLQSEPKSNLPTDSAMAYQAFQPSNPWQDQIVGIHYSSAKAGSTILGVRPVKATFGANECHGSRSKEFPTIDL
jgi:hypothetical protein